MIVTPFFRISFPHLFELYLNPKSKKMEYSCTAIFPPGTDFGELNKLLADACIKKWGPDKKQWPGQNPHASPEARFKFPIKEALAKAKQDSQGNWVYPPGYEEGGKYCIFKSANPPGIVDQKKKPIDIVDQHKIYSGAWCRAYVNAYAYQNEGCGCGLGLVGIQLVRDDKPLMHKADPTEYFTPITQEDGGTNKDSGAESAESYFT